MRAITVRQPWAQLIAIGAKRYETRSWRTMYRGRIAIHASASMKPHERELLGMPAFAQALGSHARSLKHGAIIAVAQLDDCMLCRPVTHDNVGYPENLFGDFSAGRYRLMLSDVVMLPKPIYCRGSLSIWNVAPEIESRVLLQTD